MNDHKNKYNLDVHILLQIICSEHTVNLLSSQSAPLWFNLLHFSSLKVGIVFALRLWKVHKASLSMP